MSLCACRCVELVLLEPIEANNKMQITKRKLKKKMVDYLFKKKKMVDFIL